MAAYPFNIIVELSAAQSPLPLEQVPVELCESGISLSRIIAGGLQEPHLKAGGQAPRDSIPDLDLAVISGQGPVGCQGLLIPP